MKTIYLKSEFSSVYSKQTFEGDKKESIDVILIESCPMISKYQFLTCETINMSECSKDEFINAYNKALEMLKI